ncbi:hypothetical protein BPJM79_20213 [Bacillus pumilus]
MFVKLLKLGSTSWKNAILKKYAKHPITTSDNKIVRVDKP